MKRLPILLGLTLLSGAAVASAAIKGSKSNSSDKMVCRDLACCKANPNAVASNGQPCSAILKMNSGHASEKLVDKSSPKLLREGSPVTPTPNEQKGRGLGIAAHKEGQPTTPTVTPTSAPVEGKPVKQQVEAENQRLRQQQLRLKGRVLSQQGRTFTVEVAQMKTGDYWSIPTRRMVVTFYGAKSGNGLVMPNVGTTVEVTYVQTPDGQFEAITFGREKAAEKRSKGQKGSIQGLEVPATPTPTPAKK